YSLSRVLSITALLGLTSCASAPRHINDICSVFDQNDGWIIRCQSQADRAGLKHGIPVPELMATLHTVSGLNSHARPPTKWYLGFMPGKRPSTAYGYSQALDGTWGQYRRESGNFSARRNKFADAVDFVGWYHAKSADTLGIARNDTYNLYLAYYLGWNGYK